MKNVFEVLSQLHITYVKYDHPPIFTVKEAEMIDAQIDAEETKNLFLQNKKKDKFYLVIIKSKKRVDLRKLMILVSDKLSFGSPEKMQEYLGLTPGSVSPFGLINDQTKQVCVLVDNELLKSEKIGFHPNINTATLSITAADFKKFLDWTGNEIRYVDFE